MNERTNGMEEAEAPVYQGYTHSALQAAFELVSNRADWKGPISVLVKGGDVAIVCAAIVYFTATSPAVSMTITPATGICFLVESVGYRMGPAGDH